jgi:signal peptidase I
MAFVDDGSQPRTGASPDGGPSPEPVTAPGAEPADEPTAVAPAGSRRRRKKSSPARTAIEWVLVLAGALLVAFCVRTFLLAAFYIPSASMVSTLEEGDRVLVNKLSYRLHDVNRGDIVVFERPPSEPDNGIVDYIKRVIALPGETVGAVDNQLYITGTDGQRRPLEEGYLDEGTVTLDFGPEVVPAGHVFVMGDNRAVSIDSRSFGAIPESSIVGRAFLRFWPLTHLGFL